VEEIAANEACGKKIELWFQDEALVCGFILIKSVHTA
jgi:hypothetical protein